MSVDLGEQYDKVYRYCYFKIHNRDTAEDLTQETFLRYFAQTSYINRGKQLAYLYTIARNLCHDYYRKQKPEYSTDIAAVSGEVEWHSLVAWQDATAQLEKSASLFQAVQSLPEELRELVLLRYVNELAVGEISGILGLSRFVLYRREKEAMKRLQQILGEEDYDE